MFSGVKNSKHKRKCNDIKKRKRRQRSNDKAVYEHQNKKQNNKRKKDKLHKGFKGRINIVVSGKFRYKFSCRYKFYNLFTINKLNRY